MRPLALVALLLLPLFASGPAAASVCEEVPGVAFACAQEADGQVGDCPTADGFDVGSTELTAGVPAAGAGATFFGYSSCQRRGGTTYEGERVTFDATIAGVDASVRWWSEEYTAPGSTYSGCGIEVRVAGTPADQPCPLGLGPPHAGWGRLLP